MGMKIGIGLYPQLLTRENFKFVRQAGATHVVAHLPGWARRVGRGLPPEAMWSYEELASLKAALNEEGLQFYAIENFEVEHWYDVLLDGPQRDAQMAGLQDLLRTMGRLGIEVMGYNFSYANVWGRTHGPYARGGARTPAYIAAEAPPDTRIPNGTVWSVQYDKDAPAGDIGEVSEELLWSRFERFLKDLVPVAEAANVRLAMHPADPPFGRLRGTARLVWKPEHYQRLLDLYPSHHNCAEFCQGTVAEMDGEMDVYEAIDAYAGQQKIAYVHFRNVRGHVPHYVEEFIDAGDVDMVKALRIYKKHGFDGVLIPDHSPEMACSAPWHAGMAYALGWMRAAVSIVEAEPG
ncbi:MAG TPA: mannonate dehydratase [Chloroflexota bacterium]|nr:mannonate dehydratase [Chloroflexota bacterium]